MCEETWFQTFSAGVRTIKVETGPMLQPLFLYRNLRASNGVQYRQSSCFPAWSIQCHGVYEKFQNKVISMKGYKLVPNKYQYAGLV
jgi:hypothetical protein